MKTDSPCHITEVFTSTCFQKCVKDNYRHLFLVTERYVFCGVLQSKVDGMILKLLVTCSCTSCVAVCRGKDWRPILWKNGIRRSVIPSVLCPWRFCAETRLVSIRLAQTLWCSMLYLNSQQIKCQEHIHFKSKAYKESTAKMLYSLLCDFLSRKSHCI